MSNWPWRSLVLLVAGGFIVTVMLVPDPSPQDYSSLSTAELVDRLASPRSVVRQAAAGQLIVRGKTIAPELVRAAQTAAPNQLREIVAILEELMLSSDVRVSELAEESLEELAGSPVRSAADLAARILLRNATLRHNRAMAHLDCLGATVHVAVHQELRTDARAPDFSASPRTHLTTRLVILDGNWLGGDPGLKHIGRLFPGDLLMVHVDDDAAVSEAGLQQLRIARPDTVIRRPDQGCLGISYSRDSSDTVVTGVVPNSPADRAGLRPGDVILSIDNEPLRQFQQLSTLTRERRPGDAIRLVLNRYQGSTPVTMSIELRLGSDFRTGVCACVE
uniref:PDZ domain-containing protein n=1 Tax=Schlesneria paludicola TaxID=360056 RepID=A0A7C4LL63_9PLAN